MCNRRICLALYLIRFSNSNLIFDLVILFILSLIIILQIILASSEINVNM